MNHEYNIRDFGAVGDGKTADTDAVQRAVDACSNAGGGVVALSAGTYRSGSIQLKSNVELHLSAGARIVGSVDDGDYDDLTATGFRGENAPEGSTKSLIRAVGAENVSITGAGEINGSGPGFFDTDAPEGRFYGKPTRDRPRTLMMYACTNVEIQGVSFVDSPCWTMWLMQCRNVRIHGVTVRGDQRMNNNDGIDIDSCADVTISNCVVTTADDCVVLRAIRGMFDAPTPCANVSVTNCILNSRCQGVRIGCPSDGTIRNAVFSNLIITSENNGILVQNPRRYLAPGCNGSADVHSIRFVSSVIDCASIPVAVTVEDGIRLKRLSDLSFTGLTIRSGAPLTVSGSSETRIRNVDLSDIRIITSAASPVTLENCAGVKLSNVELTSAVDPQNSDA